MKTSRIALIALALLPAMSISAQETVDIRRAASPTVSVRINGAVRGIRIIGWDRDSVTLTGAIAPGSRLEGGPRSGSEPVTGMKFYVETTDDSVSRGNKLELHVPQMARVWVKLGSADIDVMYVRGSLDLNIVGGAVRVTGELRELMVESMDGHVSFDGTTSVGRIKTATGDVVLSASAEDVIATSISGSITVMKGAYQRGRFESVTGAITFAGDVARGADLRFETHSGPIELRLLPKTSAEFELESITGTIFNSYSPSRASTGRENRGSVLTISSGNGGASVQVRSFKGNVKLTTR